MKKRNPRAKWSSSEIEKLYHLEKTKIHHSAQHLEREKLKAYLRLMDKHRHFLQGKIDRQLPQINHLSSQLQQIKKKHDLLLKKVRKIRSENRHNMGLLHGLDSRRKKVLSKLKKLASKK